MQRTALSMVAWPVIITTSSSGRSRLMRSSSSRPLAEPIIEIEQRDVERRVRERRFGGLGALGQDELVAVLAQDPPERAQQQRLVVHDQHHAGGGFAAGRAGLHEVAVSFRGSCPPIGPGIGTLERAAANTG